MSNSHYIYVFYETVKGRIDVIGLEQKYVFGYHAVERASKLLTLVNSLAYPQSNPFSDKNQLFDEKYAEFLVTSLYAIDWESAQLHQRAYRLSDEDCNEFMKKGGYEGITILDFTKSTPRYCFLTWLPQGHQMIQEINAEVFLRPYVPYSASEYLTSYYPVDGDIKDVNSSPYRWKEFLNGGKTVSGILKRNKQLTEQFTIGYDLLAARDLAVLFPSMADRFEDLEDA